MPSRLTRTFPFSSRWWWNVLLFSLDLSLKMRIWVVGSQSLPLPTTVKSYSQPKETSWHAFKVVGVEEVERRLEPPFLTHQPLERDVKSLVYELFIHSFYVASVGGECSG